MEKEENILGTEKIGKLIKKFSIPCIISLLVNSLYNIVDQIFIGQGVGYLGNGATNVVFPLTMICLAFSLMLGDGASSYLSLKLGEKKKEEAAKGVGNGILLSAITAIFLCAISLIFLPQLLNLFGCTDNLREYAIQYGKFRSTVIGISEPNLDSAPYLANRLFSNAITTTKLICVIKLLIPKADTFFPTLHLSLKVSLLISIDLNFLIYHAFKINVTN